MLTTGSRFSLEMSSLIDREVEIFQGRGPRRRQHLPSSLASKSLAHIPLQEPFQKGLQLGRKGIRELHILWRKEVERDIPWWKWCVLLSCLWWCLLTALPCANTALWESRGCRSSFRGNGSSGNTGMSLRPGLTTVSVIRSISCLSLVLCCLKGLCLWKEGKRKH